MRSFELETKFHQMWRLPSSGAPPSRATRLAPDLESAEIAAARGDDVRD